MKVKKDDTVMVLAGSDRGKKGKVHRVLPEGNKVIVSGVNMIKRHTKPKGMARQAGIIEREAPIDISNVSVICGKCGVPSRIGYRALPDGSKARVCKACNELLS
jgi:large subunit ribosomal protein L24